MSKDAEAAPTPNSPEEIEERRKFLKRCGRFAAVTPPMMATLLTVSSVPRQAQASTIGLGNGNGKGKAIGRKKGLADTLLGG
ncbi:MAG TPA: hypothetical protein VFA23_11190 [Dongiaceae bacterium]|nr:hypothetical protein [Dongiaceae bacterium]